MSASSSAAGILALLDEPDVKLQEFALRKLHPVVDQYWAEVADSVSAIEALSEDQSFAARELAAYIAAKCFYHLEEYSDALRLALGAGEYFDVDAKNEFVERIVGQCIDDYTAVRIQQLENPEQGIQVDPRLESIVNRMFTRCFHDRAYSQAVGIAIEAHRLDVVEDAMNHAGAGTAEARHILSFTFSVAQKHVVARSYRHEVLALLARLHKEQPSLDFLSYTRCLEALAQHQEVADLLVQLSDSATESTEHLLAMQIAFDLVENDNQRFLAAVRDSLSAPREEAAGEGEAEGGQALRASNEDHRARLKQLSDILSGDVSLRLYLHFLFRNNKADLLVLKNIKKSQERFSPVVHQATVVCHGFMYCGTTVDDFLRENIKWLGQATHWARFSAVAAQGVVHKGHVHQAMELLEPYLPRPDRVGESVHVQGGSLYALGLINANRGAVGGGDCVEYLLNQLRDTHNEVVQHGASLGLGLAAMASGNEQAYAMLREVLYQDSPVAGEAAGISIGLVLLGRGPGWRSEVTTELAITEMLNHANDSTHEKTIRGIAMGLAFVAYGLEEQADVMIDQMCRDKDAVLRYGGMFAVAMAYCGTANNHAIRRLLHVAVSDVSDDVRRAAVMSLGFVLFKSPEQVPPLVSLLAESFNPHVRYGACMAIGVACAASGMPEATAVLEPLLEDDVDFVRQGAFIAMAMVLQEASEARIPKVKTFREKLAKVSADNRAPIMARMGAILATGILDAGGRNASISLQSGAGFTKMSAVVGVAAFLQYWYWFPLFHFFSLAVHPTALVGLTSDLRIPTSFQAECRSRPSLFAYPPMLEEKKEEKKERMETVELSTAVRAKAKARRKELHRMNSEGKSGEGEGTAMEDDDKKEAAAAAAAGGGGATRAADGTGAGESKEEESKEEATETKAPEPSSFIMGNPTRVTPAQKKFVSFVRNQRYQPVREDATHNLGVVMLRDSKPGEDDADLEEIQTPQIGDSSEGPEPGPPQEFEWEIDD